MNVSDLTMYECKVWEAAATGTLVDLRVGDPAIDSLDKGTEWGPKRSVRAEVITDLLTGNSEAASVLVRGVRIQGARITGELNLEASTLRCPLALLDCSFDSAINLNEATAVSVSLSGSHIPILDARQIQTRGDFRLDEGFSVSGGVELRGAHIGGQLICTGGQFSNPDGCALNAFGLSVEGGMQGILDLTGAKTSSYQDNPTTSLQKLRLEGFVYDAIEGATAKERLEWLRRNEKGYSPQIYDQLASVYRRTGHDEEARRILIAKQRRRSAAGNLAGKILGWLLDLTVGYGYRTWLAAFWLIFFLILGTWLFGSVYRGELTPANKPDVQPPFQPFFYTLDLLLPVVSLHVRDAWIAQGAAQVWSVIFIIVGWILATAVVLSLTGLLKRD